MSYLVTVRKGDGTWRVKGFERMSEAREFAKTLANKYPKPGAEYRLTPVKVWANIETLERKG